MPHMANEEHLKILWQGVEAWNKWREENPEIEEPELFEADLFGERLQGINLSGADLGGANLYGADLRNADLSGASIVGANMTLAILDGADFTDAYVGNTVFGRNDLSKVEGLDAMTHVFPSTVGIDTLYKSGRKIPEDFLRDCGVPDEFVAYLPSLIGARQAIEYYSCFISYSSKDEEFARRLYSRMRDEHLRVWFAPEELKGGEKLREQIDRAIQVHDRLLIVLSEHSLCSKWVETEIRRARATEVREKRRKLFPIRLVGYERLQAWECFDSDTGEDLAREVREYYIPDFTNWKEHDSFETEFAKLLKALRAAEQK